MGIATAENTMASAAGVERLPDPCAMVIFGASGDLAKRKLVPALFNLWREHLLPRGFSVVGFSRTEMTDQEFRAAMREAVEQFGGRPLDRAAWDDFAQGLFYLAARSDHPEHYPRLAALLTELDRRRGTGGNRLFYLAVPPSSFLGIVHCLEQAGLAQPQQGWARIVIEKPFGRDLESARRLNEELAKVFREEQIYRIDHYLGKETVQNLIVFRFANGIFEPIWNRRYVDNVQITAAEKVGVENRAAYYEEAGALRDMVQNHMLQLLSLTAMEPPPSIAADAVRLEKLKVLRSIAPLADDRVAHCVVRGQYGPGFIDGKPVPGYRSEPGVAPDSRTETYVALKLFIENWRWAGVPFYLRTGKRLPQQVTEIAIQFKQPPLMLFDRSPVSQIAPNVLVVRIQPDERIFLKFAVKVPGPGMHIRPVKMDFRYAMAFGMSSSGAYERLLLDCMLGDQSLFAHRDSVEAAWALVTPILETWESGPPPDFPNYAAGTWGPAEAEALLQGSGCPWHGAQNAG